MDAPIQDETTQAAPEAHVRLRHPSEQSDESSARKRKKKASNKDWPNP
jgi:hypothetical protein